MKKTMLTAMAILLCIACCLIPVAFAAEEHYEIEDVSLSAIETNGVNVYLTATGDCTMMVAMYSSDMQMLDCEMTAITGDEAVQYHSVVLDLKGREMAVTKVFLLDKTKSTPLCESYVLEAGAQSASNYNITGIRRTTGGVDVSCITEEACSLTVRIWDEYMEKTLFTGSAQAGDNLSFEEVFVALDGSWPSYYVISAQLFDEDGKALCPPFYMKKHTQKYEQFNDRQPEDFDDNLVLDLEEAGFCVLVEDAKSADEIGTSGNTIVVQCASQVKPGDVLLINETDGEKNPILVKTATRSGSDFLVTPDEEAGIADIFQVVKINGNVDVGQASQDNGEVQLMSLDDPNEWDDGSSSKDLVNMTHSLSAGPLDVTVSVTATAVVNIIYDADLFGEDYIESETYIDMKGTGVVELTAGVKSSNLKDAFGRPVVPCIEIYDGPLVIGGFGILSLDLNLTAPLEFEFGGGGTMTVEFSGKSGYVYDTNNGHRDLSDYSASAEAKVGADFQVRFGPKVALELKFARGLLEGEVSGSFGGIVRGEISHPVQDITTGTKNHACLTCCDLNVSVFYRANASLGVDVGKYLEATLISIDLLSGERTMWQGYASLQNEKDSIFEGKFAMGEGLCPNYKYRVLIYTENEDGERLYGIPVSVFREGEVKEEGASTLRAYLYDGDHTAFGYFDSATYHKAFTVNRAPMEVTIREQKTILSGTVTDKATQEPISGARVRIQWEDGSTLTTSTNADGFYTFSFYPNGKGTVRFEAENYAAKTSILSVIPGQENTLDAKLESCYNVTVTVLGTDAKPMANMPIHGTLLGQDPVTGTDGTVSFELTGGEYTLSTYNDTSGDYLDVTVDQDMELTLELENNFMEWRFDEPTSTLYIWGHGPMGNYYGTAPWEAHKAQIQTVDIKGMRSIGAQAFDKYPAITTVILSDTMESIGYEAFVSCGALTTLDVGQGLTYIGGRAFQYCSSLTALELPDSFDTLDYCAFQYCSSLADVDFGEGVRAIEASAFAGAGVTSVILPETLESTGNSAFDGCASLQDVYIPGCETGTTLNLKSFYNCTALSSVVLGENVKHINDDVFMNCTSLDYLDLGGVTSIGKYAFQGCTSLVTLELPDTLVSIGPSAFGYCSSLGSVSIPASVTSIENYAFQHCGMTSVEIVSNEEGLVVPVGAFQKCTALTSAVLGEGVTSLGTDAFSRCESLSSVSLPSTLETIGGSAFFMTDLRSVTIPDSVTSIGSNAFAYCENLSSVQIGSGVTSLGAAAFTHTGLTSVTVPENVTDIGNYAFERCESLSSATIEGNPDGTKIHTGVFQHCTKLSHVTLGDGVTYIGTNSFWGCDSLSSVSCSTWSSIEIKGYNDPLIEAYGG